MKVAQVVLIVLHLLGVLALLVGLLVQVRHPEKRVTGPMRDGIGTTFLAGLLAGRRAGGSRPGASTTSRSR